MSVKPEAIIYTDGACKGNPGPGGWATVVIIDGKETRLSGGAPETTNNRMELMGVINGINALRGPHLVTIYSDSQYVVNAFNQNWLESWKDLGWRRKDGELANRDLWMMLDKITKRHSIKWVWVKGHAGNKYNEICDEMATSEANRYAEDTSSSLWRRNEAEVETAAASTEEFPIDDLLAPEPIEAFFDPNEPVPPDLFMDISENSTGSSATVQPLPILDKYAGALTYFDIFMRKYNEEKTGLKYPCGAFPWCEHCHTTLPGESDDLCAKAFIDYTVAGLMEGEL